MKTFLRVLIVGLAAASSVTIASTSGHALQQGSVSLSRSDSKFSKSYGPIAATNTSLTHYPSDCRTAAYCAELDVHVDARAGAHARSGRPRGRLRAEQHPDARKRGGERHGMVDDPHHRGRRRRGGRVRRLLLLAASASAGGVSRRQSW